MMSLREARAAYERAWIAAPAMTLDAATALMLGAAHAGDAEGEGNVNRYRINYGNGQVSREYSSLDLARRDLVSLDDPNARLEKYHYGTADEPGDWFRIVSERKP